MLPYAMQQTFSHRIRKILVPLCVLTGSIVLGFLLSKNGITVMEDDKRYGFSLWLLHKYGLRATEPEIFEVAKMYAPLWDFILAVCTEFIFSSLHDPYWVRHALTVALFPIGLYYTYRILLRASVHRSTAVLAIAMLYGCIRLGGYSIQTKDFPVAMAYTWVSVYMWIHIRTMQKKGLQLPAFRSLALLTVASLVPYLLRVPLLFHFVLLEGIVIAFVLRAKNEPLWKRIAVMVFPLVLGIFIHYILFPAYWGKPIWEGWILGIQSFSEHPNIKPQRFFGNMYPTDSLPWWYMIGWIPMMMHPIVFVLMILGIGSIVLHKERGGEKIFLPVLTSTISFSLLHWLSFLTILSWAGMLVIQPSLYNGFRHVLFLYPQLLIVAALGLHRIQNQWKILICIAIIGISTMSYWQWKRYAYIYIPALFPYTDTSHFMGDTRHICIPKAVDFAVKFIPEGEKIFYARSEDIALQYDRYETSILLRTTPQKPLLFVENPGKKGETQYMIASSQSLKTMRIVDEKIQSGAAEVLWKDTLPTGETACLIIQY